MARGKVHTDHRYEIRSGNKYNQLITSRRSTQKRTKDQLLKRVIYLLMDVPCFTLAPNNSVRKSVVAEKKVVTICFNLFFPLESGTWDTLAARIVDKADPILHLKDGEEMN